MGKTIFNDNRFSIKVLSGETMLYDSANDRTHFLNPTAVKILELAYEGKNKEEIEKAVREFFNIRNDEDIEKDIEKALALFRKNRLIE